MTCQEFGQELLDAERAAQQTLNSMSNWGRWGADDQLGAANLITPEAVSRGIGAVSAHRVYSLGAEIGSRRSPRLSLQPAPRHFMEIYADADDVGRTAGEHPFAVDTILIATHGTTTHVDGLSHVWADGRLYNGGSSATVTHDGARLLGIEHLGAIATRGLLLDIAARRGVPHLSAWDLVTERDVRDCLEEASLTVQPGDAVLIRTGWNQVYQRDRREYARAQPGLSASAGLYLASRDVCLVGSDNSGVQPGYAREGDPRRGLSDLHLPFLRNLGIYLLEMLDLDALAGDRVREFMLCLAPLRITGGTGSPVNPTAIA